MTFCYIAYSKENIVRWKYFKIRAKQIFWNEDNRVRIRNLNYLPRWLVLIIDLATVVFSFFMTFFIASHLNVSFYDVLSLWEECVFISLIYFSSFFLFSTYAGLIRHSTFVDIFKIAFSCGFSAVFLAAISYGHFLYSGNKIFLIPFLIINAVITFSCMLMLRILVKSLYTYMTNMGRKKYRVLILGVSDDCIAVGEALSISDRQNFVLAGFVSFKKRYQKLKIQGAPIFKYDEDFFDVIAPYKVNGFGFIILVMANHGTTATVGNYFISGIKKMTITDCS